MAQREVSPETTGSQSSPEPPRHGNPSLSSQYRSSFELECLAIAGRLELGLPAASPLSSETSSPFPGTGELLTSTPLRLSPPPARQTPAGPAPEGSQPSAAPEPSFEEFAGSFSEPSPGPVSEPSPAPPPVRPRKAAQRGTGQQPRGGVRSAGRSRGGLKVSLLQARAPGLRHRYRGEAGGAAGDPRCGRRCPPSSSGSGLQRPGGASQLPQTPTIPKAAPRAAGSGQGQPVLEPRCSSTLELPERSERRECPVAAEPAPGAGRADETYVCAESSFSSRLSLELASHPGSEDAVPAEQAVWQQLSQRLEHLQNELEQIKAQIAALTAQVGAIERMIFSMWDQLRAAGILPEDAGAEESGDARRA